MAEQQIIIKRIKKVEGGHHGGAWKVAYADFVTAMMAFFLLLWLLNAVTEEQLTGISNYFAPTMASQNQSGAGAILGGQVIGQGALSSNTSSPSLMQHLPPTSIGPGGEDLTSSNGTDAQQGMNEKDFREHLAEREQEKFDKAEELLQNAIKGIPELKPYQGSLLVDNTPEGLRIQLTDQDGLAMFPSGSAAMYGYTRSLLDMVARIVNQLPNKISISGYTDSVPYQGNAGYTNWELSADRALASRRILVKAGVSENRIDRVVGKADTDPLVPNDPKSPRNRRISIILLRDSDLQSPPAIAPGALPSPAATPSPPPAAPSSGAPAPAR
jgi:chemotaxis protein MotB